MPSGQYKTDYATMTIEKCFANHYVVPEYQREYVWEESNIEQLLSDLVAAFHRNEQKPYFLGMTVVYGGQEATLELVDGQQRVTTFFIILCAISHIYAKNNDDSGKVFEDLIHGRRLNDNGDAVDTYALELQYNKSSDCLNDIFNNRIPDEATLATHSLSDQRLFNAYQAIIKTLNVEFSVFAELKKFAAYVCKKVEFVQIETSDIADALNIFETINERGIGLNPMDLLKNMIFMNVPKDRFSELNKEWKKLIDSLEGIKEKPLRFLRYFISATYDVIDPATGTVNGILPEDNIYSWLTNNDSQCHYKADPFGFVELLNNSIDRYKGFLFPNTVDQGNEYLRNIPRVAGTSYRLHLVLLMAASKMDANTLGCFKQVLESVLYYAVVCSIKANETEKLFAAWCTSIRKIKDINDLKSFVDSTISPQLKKWKTDYHQRFLALSLNSMQQYRIRYVLSRIIKYVDDYRGGGTKYADIDSYYDKKNQIEHIMPQTCPDTSAYGLTEEEHRIFVGSLGNLTLLERTFNASCQNKTYAEKCTIYPSSAFYLTKSLPALEASGPHTAATKINSELSSWTAWNKQSIEERQEMLYKLSEKIWAVENYSWNQSLTQA